MTFLSGVHVSALVITFQIFRFSDHVFHKINMAMFVFFQTYLTSATAFKLFWPHKDRKTPKKTIINHKGTRMVKDGED